MPPFDFYEFDALSRSEAPPAVKTS